MKEPYGEGLAIHTGPESCVGVREGAGEALTGAPMGWPRKTLIRGADPPWDYGGLWGRQYGRARSGEHPHGLAWSQAPMHVWNLLARKPGDLRGDRPNRS